MEKNVAQQKPKVALVTGAARGIGAAIAWRLAGTGYDVAINYMHSKAEALALAEDIRAAGRRAVVLQADVASFEQVSKLVNQTCSELGGLDLLVNNAGINRDGLLVRMKPGDFDGVLHGNLSSAFYCSRFAAAIMMRQRSGAIINIASVAGILGNAGQANYAASKAGIIGLTKSMARELASRGIRVNAVAPGVVDTDMTRGMPVAALEKLVDVIPMGRIGQPDDVARAVAFLASDAARYITGQVLCVDGGMAI